MRSHDVNREVFFAVFFGIGVMSLVFSVLLQSDLFQYCQDRILLRSMEQTVARLESLNSDYDTLLQRLDTDPCLIENVATATLGTERADANTVYPRASAQDLAIARKTLAAGGFGDMTDEPNMPGWFVRCSDPRRRILLFFAGASLIIISFVCFGTIKRDNDE